MVFSNQSVTRGIAVSGGIFIAGYTFFEIVRNKAARRRFRAMCRRIVSSIYLAGLIGISNYQVNSLLRKVFDEAPGTASNCLYSVILTSALVLVNTAVAEAIRSLIGGRKRKPLPMHDLDKNPFIVSQHKITRGGKIYG